MKNQIKDTIRKLEPMALRGKMCDPFLCHIRRARNVDDLLRLYKAGLDWALDNNIPDVKLLQESCSAQKLERYGIFINKHFKGETVNDNIFQVFHNCTGSINVELNREKCIIPTLYLANNTNLNINVNQSIDISVFLLDSSKANVNGKFALRKIACNNEKLEDEFPINFNNPEL